ncbi:putative thiazole-containing bacteriocin maturation protein [Alkalihalobacterium chitinilyticum]|uniref:Thiazole-containing bacteriocin maturation protein n=1 Tax=Alkalihalobacterium chitinilyticum TaxID=2980103 RepID=A0ABT5VFY9_9BACI|nr:putative thiazole-containing bacteriocin maturation protein [Alkalihalobacterium chitinilyticum]MDE5414242.1 putative thiazole-containing bacteriocin maturation protein [Alkalihalobacterium chitinilyticum]
MTKLNASTRLKVKKDTFYIPDQEGGVYFRNNESSFRLKGSTIYQWIETLMPMFNGEQTLGDLTKGLTEPYKKRVYEIGETLYENGFLRDISQDRPHQLNRTVVEKYASQIEFIESFVDSGAYHFQEYRQAKILAVGAGPILVSLVGALLESGLPKFHYISTQSTPPNLARIDEMVENARKDDSEVEVKEISFQKGEYRSAWKEVVQPYDCVLYVSQDGNVHEIMDLNLVCKEERKVFLPAVCLEQVGLAGPMVHQGSDGCWESAWRRLHQSAVQETEKSANFSSTAGSMLANVLVFEFFKKAVGIASQTQKNQIYFLDLETLEGNWLSYLTHPLVLSSHLTPRLIEDLDLRIKQEVNRNSSPSTVLEYFSRLTSEEAGIFHSWEERDLPQLPLAQCYVQAVNPMSDGPATLLSEVVCAGFTHEQAKRQAGLTGIEMYVSQLIEPREKRYKNDQMDSSISSIPESFMGIGAGQTIEEAVCRGLQNYLDEILRERKVDQPNLLFELEPESIEDQQVRYYLNALTTLNGLPKIDLREDILGFPVIRIKSNGRRYTRAGLNRTLALRYALEQALLNTQDEVNSLVRDETVPAEFVNKKKSKLNIPSCDGMTPLELLQSSIQLLKQNRKRLDIYDLSFEPFLQEELAGVFGVKVREEEYEWQP